MIVKYTSFENGLGDLIPSDAIEEMVRLWNENLFQLTVSRPRKSKNGDFRPDPRGRIHRISVNANLNKYQFLHVLVHEYAHLVVWKKYQQKVKAHGQEWKNEFNKALMPFVQLKVFPDDLKTAILSDMNNPKAGSYSNVELQKAFRKYDEQLQQVTNVEDLPLGALFVYGNKLYKKERKLRKNYLCVQVDSQRKYRFNPLAQVSAFEEV